MRAILRRGGIIPGGFEWLSAVVGTAFAASWRYKIGIVPVIAASGAAGLLYTLIKPLAGA